MHLSVILIDSVSNRMKKGFGSEPVYNEKYLKTEMKFFEGRINTRC